MRYCKQFFTIYILSVCFAFSLNAQVGKINTPNAKLRDCDDVKCAIIGELKLGERCKIIGRGKTELLDSYGTHSWLQVRVGNKIGYVFGGLIDIINNNSSDIAFRKSGYIRPENVNVRACAELKDCDIIFRLKKGEYCTITSKSKHETEIKGLGKHPWYFIEKKGKKGYVFGGLVTLESNKIEIIKNAKIYDYPDTLQGQVVDRVVKGDLFHVNSQSKKSQLLRPYGRYYWYELISDDERLGWVFGAYTSKALIAPVDCQCVDFVKNTLEIKGPTKNAFEWDQVLKGGIPVMIKGKEVFLDYYEILNLDDIRKGDIVTFHRDHPESDSTYGHIGIVDKLFDQNAGGRSKVGVEGANHTMPMKAFYSKKRCNNVSRKKYLLDENVRFFRPVENTDAR